MALSTNNQGTDFDIKKSYAAYPSSGVTDGTVYVRQGSVTSGNDTVDGPEYSARLGSGTGLQLDKDKVYTVENQAYQNSGTGGGTGNYVGTIPGLTAYFDGLKFLYNLDLFYGADDDFYMNINSLGQKRVYDTEGNLIDVSWIKVGWALLQYSTTIPNENDPTSPFSGFQVISYTRDPEQVGNQLYLKRSGGTMLGNINMNRNMVTNLDDPTNGRDAVNKDYVDTLSNDLEVKIENLESSVFGVSDPDVLADDIDGTMPVTYAYMTVQIKEKVTIEHDILKFSTAMTPNTCVHIFVYCSRTVEASESDPNTYDASPRYFAIPGRICGGVTNAQTPTVNDYTWINGSPTYIGADGNGGSAYTGPSYRYFVIPERGMIEISVFYNKFKIGNTDYTRTVVKCDAEEGNPIT